MVYSLDSDAGALEKPKEKNPSNATHHVSRTPYSDVAIVGMSVARPFLFLNFPGFSVRKRANYFIRATPQRYGEHRISPTKISIFLQSTRIMQKNFIKIAFFDVFFNI